MRGGRKGLVKWIASDDTDDLFSPSTRKAEKRRCSTDGSETVKRVKLQSRELGSEYHCKLLLLATSEQASPDVTVSQIGKL